MAKKNKIKTNLYNNNRNKQSNIYESVANSLRADREHGEARTTE